MSNLIESKKFPVTLRNDLFTPFEKVFDEFFTDFFRGTSSLDKVRAQAGYPKMNVYESDGELVLQAAVPGVPPESVHVEMLDDSTVEISGQMPSNESPLYSESTHYYIRELSTKSFTRRLTLPVNLGDPKFASIKDGILTLRWDLPGKNESARRLVEVKSE